jgi:hypothetical protein
LSGLGGMGIESMVFQSMLVEKHVNYILKTASANSSAQNRFAEKPNQHLARMMHSILYGAGLGSQYWVYAIRHAVYLKKQLPHKSLQYMTLYEKLNGMKPDLSKTQVLSASRVHFMNKECINKKLDKMDRVGTLMTFKGTDKISYVINTETGCQKYLDCPTCGSLTLNVYHFQKWFRLIGSRFCKCTTNPTLTAQQRQDRLDWANNIQI